MLRSWKGLSTDGSAAPPGSHIAFTRPTGRRGGRSCAYEPSGLNWSSTSVRNTEVSDRAPGLREGQQPASATAADPLWDDWDTPPRVPGVPVLHLDGFDGPMDLLLELADRKRIDLRLMSPRDMVDQFVTEMQRLESRVPIERRADWLVLATRLVLLRSRLVFPADAQEAADAERDAAKQLRNLNELAAMRAAAQWP